MNPLNRVEEVQKLFIQHASTLRGFIYGFQPDMHRANDIFQELFITIIKKSGDFDLNTNFLAWARTIARNKAYESFRENKNAPTPLNPEVLDSLFASVPEPHDDWELRQEALNQCMEELSPKIREMVDSRYVEGLLPPQIAKKFCRGIDSINVTLARARKTLRECADRKLGRLEGAS